MERNNLETFLTYAKELAYNKESSGWFLITMCYENNFCSLRILAQFRNFTALVLRLLSAPKSLNAFIPRIRRVQG